MCKGGTEQDANEQVWIEQIRSQVGLSPGLTGRKRNLAGQYVLTEKYATGKNRKHKN